jgi:hypothetical protein
MRRESAALRRLLHTVRSGRAAGFRRRASLGALLAAAMTLPFAGCTVAQRASQSPSYVFIQSLVAASGATPDKFGGTLASDVLTYVKQQVNGATVPVPTIYADPAQVILKLALKDPGPTDTPTVPSTTNYITLTRYHVDFVRADGRNTQGVDVPYSFDGGLTATVTADGATVSFTLVRVQAKEEAPLKQLAGGGGAVDISTIAQVTFYGADQAGHEVSATGNISVNFSDWGDPQ